MVEIVNPMRKFKGELKEMANKIRTFKGYRPQENRKNYEIEYIESTVAKMSATFRWMHVAYCELRGRSREDIEKPAENHALSKRQEENINKKKVEIWEAFKSYHEIRAAIKLQEEVVKKMAVA
jgi:hypothetical protein